MSKPTTDAPPAGPKRKTTQSTPSELCRLVSHPLNRAPLGPNCPLRLGAGSTLSKSEAGANHSSEQERMWPPKATDDTSVVRSRRGKSVRDNTLYWAILSGFCRQLEVQRESKDENMERSFAKACSGVLASKLPLSACLPASLIYLPHFPSPHGNTLIRTVRPRQSKLPKQPNSPSRDGSRGASDPATRRERSFQSDTEEW